jgi:16S rRNA (uracil1498-N3)-methyltransferase
MARAVAPPDRAATAGPAVAEDLAGMPDPAACAHVFVEELDALELRPADAHHLAHVLRLRSGDLVTASDGAGRWRRCRLAVAAGVARLEADGPVVHAPRPVPAVTVGFALPKRGRPEWAVQKLTEAGVDRVVPLRSARSVVRWDGPEAGLERLRRVAREAAMQARLAYLPEVAPLSSFADAVAALADAGGALADPAGEPLSLATPAVLVGPEGGFDEAERACGLPLVRLGPTRLRTETAAVAAGLLLCALRSGSVRAAAWSPPTTARGTQR